MMAMLPTGIEAYLKEAGFSSTEMLVLRKLLEEDSLTIRELSHKTGKSLGLLDQAMKKLLGKHIARKEMLNGQPRYAIDSLESISRWMKKDMRERKELIERRHQNFEQFICSIKVDKKRPDMEYFQGLEGIQQAYEKLLAAGSEFLTMTPILHLTEDDPLRAFRVQLFRHRQVRKIFQRVLAPNSPLARRFQSRDPFEFRQTLLLPQSELPITFEKTIVGDTIACINFQEESACFIKYPALAEIERSTFETLWARADALERGEAHTSTPLPPNKVSVPLTTRFFSRLREFILSRRSILALIFFALLAGVLTFGLYKSNRDLNLRRMEDKVMAIASTGALQLDAKDIEAVKTAEDIEKPEYAKLVATLNLIRRSNSGIQYTYVMRQTQDPNKLAFVADADSLNPREKKDINHDGTINNADELSYPGEMYDVTHGFENMQNGFKYPVTDLGTDQWGTFISGFAPIRDSEGTSVAILGIDIFAKDVDKLSAESFTPLYAFIGFFMLFMAIRFWAENRSFMNEFWIAMKKNMRITVLWIMFIAVCIFGLLFGFQEYKYRLLLEQTGKRLMAIAVTAATEFDPEDLDQLHWARDMKTEAYQRVFNTLNDIRNRNPDIKFAYLMRPTQYEQIYEFIADADSNYNLPYLWVDFDRDGALTNADINVWPGFQWTPDFPRTAYAKGGTQPAYGDGYSQWGHAVSGIAPIYDAKGKFVGFLGLDIDMNF